MCASSPPSFRGLRLRVLKPFLPGDEPGFAALFPGHPGEVTVDVNDLCGLIRPPTGRTDDHVPGGDGLLLREGEFHLPLVLLPADMPETALRILQDRRDVSDADVAECHDLALRLRH